MIHDGVLDTPRLAIRPFAPGDASWLVALFADPAVARFVGDGEPLSRSEAELWVRRSRENLAAFGYGTGAVIERASGRPIGWAGFARPGDGSEEIVYGLAAAHWRQGYGREIVAALVGFAAGRGIDPVHATVDPANLASIRLLEAHGFALAERGHKGDPGSDLYRLCGRQAG